MSRCAWGFLLMVAVALCACTPGTPYHRFLPLSQEGWDRADTVAFDLPVIADARECKLQVELRATRLFPYTDLWIGVEQRDSDQVLLCYDTLHIDMADSTGRLDGHGLTLLEYASAPLSLASMPKGECRQVRLFHLMSRETVAGLLDVGLCVSRSQR